MRYEARAGQATTQQRERTLEITQILFEGDSPLVDALVNNLDYLEDENFEHVNDLRLLNTFRQRAAEGTFLEAFSSDDGVRTLVRALELRAGRFFAATREHHRRSGRAGRRGKILF